MEILASYHARVQHLELLYVAQTVLVDVILLVKMAVEVIVHKIAQAVVNWIVWGHVALVVPEAVIQCVSTGASVALVHVKVTAHPHVVEIV